MNRSRTLLLIALTCLLITIASVGPCRSAGRSAIRETNSTTNGRMG